MWNCIGEMPDQEKGDLEIKSYSEARGADGQGSVVLTSLPHSPKFLLLLPGQDLEGCWHLVGLPCNIMKSHSWFLIPRFAMAGSVWSLLSWEREGGEAVSRKGRSQQLAAQHILGGRKNVLPQSVVEQQDSSRGDCGISAFGKERANFDGQCPLA